MNALREMKLSLLSYCRSSQSVRDGLCLALFLLACAGYEHFLGVYFHGIPQKLQLSLAFTSSLGFALWYEFKYGDWRGSLIRMTGITLVFMGAAYLAPHARHEYFAMLAEARNEPEMIKAFTAEGLTLMANPLAGFGACFGLSVMATRVIFGGFIVRALSRVVAHDARVDTCPHCKEAIPR